MLLIQVDFYKRKADSGDPEAQLALGQLYYYGVRGFEQNIDRALELFERAAIQGAGEGYAMIGNIYAARAQDAAQQLQDQAREAQYGAAHENYDN